MRKIKIKEYLNSMFYPHWVQIKNRVEEFRLYDVVSTRLNRWTPREHFDLVSNVSYGEHARQTFDLYRTKKPRQEPVLIIFVHGGTWSHGKKEDYLFVGESFAREGFDVAIINYRLAPEFKFPAYVDDFVLALNHLEEQLPSHQMVLMGHSAGAFNIMSAVYHPQKYAFHAYSKIKMIIGLAGPYHFNYMGDSNLEQAFDVKRTKEETMPYYFVQNNSIEHILLLASKDFLVARSNTMDMHAALKAQKNKSKVEVIPRTGHISLIGSLSSHLSQFFKTKTVILREIERCLNQTSS